MDIVAVSRVRRPASGPAAAKRARLPGGQGPQYLGKISSWRCEKVGNARRAIPGCVAGARPRSLGEAGRSVMGASLFLEMFVSRRSCRRDRFWWSTIPRYLSADCRIMALTSWRSRRARRHRPTADGSDPLRSASGRWKNRGGQNDPAYRQTRKSPTKRGLKRGRATHG